MAVGNLSPREQSEVKAAVCAYLCIHKSRHTHECAHAHKHSDVVLRETAALKKPVWHLMGSPDWWNQSGVSREGMAYECFVNASSMQP